MNPTIRARRWSSRCQRRSIGGRAYRGGLLVQHLGLLAILDDREDQTADAETDHHQPDAARRGDASGQVRPCRSWASKNL